MAVPNCRLGEVGSDAERRRVIKTLDGTMVDRFKIAVYAVSTGTHMVVVQFVSDSRGLTYTLKACRTP